MNGDSGSRPTSEVPGLLESLWRFRWLVLLLTLAAGAAGYGVSSTSPTLFEATTRLHLADEGSGSIFGTRVRETTTRLLANESARITSSPVLEGAAEEEEISPRELRGKVRTETPAETDVIDIIVTDPDPDRAASLANGVADSYLSVTTQARLEDAQRAVVELEEYRKQLEARIVEADGRLAAIRAEVEAEVESLGLNSTDSAREMERRLELHPAFSQVESERNAAFTQMLAVQTKASELAVDAAAAGSGVELTEPATAPTRPVQPRPLLGALIGGVLGLVAAAALAWWLADRRRRVSTGGEPAVSLNIPMLGTVPSDRSLRGRFPVPTLEAPRSRVSEAYNFLVASLLGGEGSRLKRLLVSSPLPGDGKTVTALNLALAVGKRGRSVVLIDADLRTKGLTRVAEAQGRMGLTDLAAGMPIHDCLVEFEVGGGRKLLLLPAGSDVEEPASFLASEAFSGALDQLSLHAGLLVLDTPSFLVFADALEVSSRAAGIVLVLTPGTPTEALDATSEALIHTRTPVLGYVYNKSQTRQAPGVPRRLKTRRRRRPRWKLKQAAATVRVTEASGDRVPR